VYDNRVIRGYTGVTTHLNRSHIRTTKLSEEGAGVLIKRGGRQLICPNTTIL
jgi:hypothetical protein